MVTNFLGDAPGITDFDANLAVTADYSDHQAAVVLMDAWYP